MKKAWNVIFSILLLAYLVVAVAWSRTQAADALCEGMRIEVNDTASTGFVTAVEIGHELNDLNARAKGMRLSDINTDSIERILGAIDRIEEARAIILNDRHILVEVTPMRPVARVFDGDHSYYINKDGKRITANARYHVDVPVIAGNFTDGFKAASLLPLVNYIEGSDQWRSLISMISAPDSRNIFLVPIIRGHVINIGNLDHLDDKFSRIDRFYREVLPVKGWNHYDTLSVKWDGQLVATRRVKNLAHPMTDVDIESENEDPDMGTMLTEGDSPAIPHDNPNTNNQ